MLTCASRVIFVVLSNVGYHVIDAALLSYLLTSSPSATLGLEMPPIPKLNPRQIYHRIYSREAGNCQLAMSQPTRSVESVLSSPYPLNPPTQRKKLRVVCVSDTHNSSPLNGQFKVPPGDVLIHAGDMTNQGSYAELKKVVEWLGRCEHEVKLVIAGTVFYSLQITSSNGAQVITMA